MVLKADQERVMGLLKDTITLLCKNGLNFKSKFCVDAVIGVTVDEDELFYISVKEVVKSEQAVLEEKSAASSADSDTSLSAGDRDHKRRRRKRRIKNENERQLDGASVKQSETNELGSTDPVSARAGQHSTQSDNESSSKRVRVKKEEEEEEEETDEDIVFIKQELDDNSWSQSQDLGANVGGQSFGDFADMSGMSAMQGSQQHEQDFSSLGMNLTGVEGSSAMWNSPQQRRPYVPRGPRTSTVTSNSQLQQAANMSGSSEQGSTDPQQQNENHHRCNECGKMYSSLHGLKLHKRYHNGEYRYRCTFCEKGFMSSTGLQGHMSIHTGIKEFPCHICGKEFAYKEAHKRHLITVHKMISPA